MKLIDYIDKHYAGNKSAFARANGLAKQALTDMMKRDYIIINNNLYLKRRELLLEPQIKTIITSKAALEGKKL